jgi:hypothetical protein
MALAALGISALTLLCTLVILGRLHTLATTLAERAQAADRAEAEAKFLRTQVSSLQEKLLAVTAPAAQARLHVQEHPEAKPLAEQPSRVVPWRNPMQIEVPEGWQHPEALGGIALSDREAKGLWEPLGE